MRQVCRFSPTETKSAVILRSVGNSLSHRMSKRLLPVVNEFIFHYLFFSLLAMSLHCWCKVAFKHVCTKDNTEQS